MVGRTKLKVSRFIRGAPQTALIRALRGMGGGEGEEEEEEADAPRGGNRDYILLLKRYRKNTADGFLSRLLAFREVSAPNTLSPVEAI